MEIPRWSSNFDKSVVNKPIKFVGTGKKWTLLMCSIHRMAKEFWNGRRCVFGERAQDNLTKKKPEKSKRKLPKMI
jgi:hypothetical protein